MLPAAIVNVFVEGTLAKECWGDGFYLDSLAKNVNFYSVTASDNRRQGMSIVYADGVVVKDSVFRDTAGTNPQHGIDIEPDPPTNYYVSNVQILNSQFINNHSRGIETFDYNKKVSRVTISGNTFTGNMAGVAVVGSNPHVITNNSVTGNYGMWIPATPLHTVTGNNIHYNTSCLDLTTYPNNTCTHL